MKFTLSQASKEAGVSKSTVSKAVASGRLSAVRLDDGSFQIEAVELFRVFPKRTAERGPEPFANPPEPSENASRSQSSDLIQLRAEMLDELLKREREERERERETWNRERETILERERATTEDLRKRLDRAEERVLALSAPAAATSAPADSQMPQERPSAPPAAREPARGLSGLLGRLWGR